MKSESKKELPREEFQAHGFPCILRMVPMGTWCGYVGVPKGHPWFGQGYDLDVNVHGGVTYGAACNEELGVCHPDDGDDERWWIGFDCAHAGDIVPGMEEPRWPEIFGIEQTYKDIDYVRKETISLAQQAAEAKQVA